MTTELATADLRKVRRLTPDVVIERLLAGVRGLYARQDALTEQTDRLECGGLLQPWPLHAEDGGRRAHSGLQTPDLIGHALGIADQEPIAGQSLEVEREALTGRQGLVLLPALIGLVFRLQERAGRGQRASPGRRHQALLDDR